MYVLYNAINFFFCTFQDKRKFVILSAFSFLTNFSFQLN